MTTQTVKKCSCGMDLLEKGCPHCDTMTCLWCAGFQYEQCGRNSQYNAQTSDRLGIMVWPLVGGVQIGV